MEGILWLGVKGFPPEALITQESWDKVEMKMKQRKGGRKEDIEYNDFSFLLMLFLD